MNLSYIEDIVYAFGTFGHPVNPSVLADLEYYSH